MAILRLLVTGDTTSKMAYTSLYDPRTAEREPYFNPIQMSIGKGHSGGRLKTAKMKRDSIQNVFSLTDSAYIGD